MVRVIFSPDPYAHSALLHKAVIAQEFVGILKGNSQPINTCKICKYTSTYVLFNTGQTVNSKGQKSPS